MDFLSHQTADGSAAETAIVVREGREETIAIEEVEVGDELIAKPDEKIAVDGTSCQHCVKTVNKYSGYYFFCSIYLSGFFSNSAWHSGQHRKYFWPLCFRVTNALLRFIFFPQTGSLSIPFNLPIVLFY